MTGAGSAAWAFDAGLTLMVVAVAVFTVRVRAPFSAAVGFVAYGLLLALAWVRLEAPDVAMTEAAIGAGLTGLLLLNAAARLTAAETRAAARPGRAMRAAAAIACAAVTGFLCLAVMSLPEPPPTLAPLAAANLPATALGNPVTAVLMAFRAIDTLLEKIVMVLALLGVWSLAADRGWGGAPVFFQIGPVAPPLLLLARLLPAAGTVVGVHLLWVAKDAPGGAFPGGTVLAATWLLAIAAGLERMPETGRRWLRAALVGGPAVFVVVGLAGTVAAGAFLAYPPAITAPLIVAIELALLVSITVTMMMLVVGPPAAPQSSLSQGAREAPR